MRMKRLFLIAIVLVMSVCSAACTQSSSGMQDGYYTAEAAAFDAFGWKEYITIYVSDDKIVTVEYNARNASGFIKSWDIEYMRTMNAMCGTYPNEYARTYAVSLMNWQSPDEIDAISGATTSHTSFHMLAAAAITQAKAGDKQVASVDLNRSEAEKAEG